MDPYICCLIGLCCPPESQEQLDTLAKILVEQKVCDSLEYAEKVAAFHVAQFNSLTKADIQKLARGKKQ